ncbi:MAG: argininosuccinate lyase, partial [Planctomycetota bacterium]|nr:argininosuccinate lyase [Planctomycetota bacterium]
GFLDATALMEYLIRLQVPMRTAHETVGRLVARCESDGLKLADLTLEQFQEIHASIDESIFDVLGTANAVAILSSQGSGGPDPVSDSLSHWQQTLGLD